MVEKHTPIKRVKLNYVSAVPHTPPVETISIPSKDMEELGRGIKAKIEQNVNLNNKAHENFKDFIVR